MKTGHSSPFHTGIDPDLKRPGTNPGEAAQLESSRAPGGAARLEERRGRMVLAAREDKGDGARRRGLGGAPAASFSSFAFSPLTRRPRLLCLLLSLGR